MLAQLGEFEYVVKVYGGGNDSRERLVQTLLWVELFSWQLELRALVTDSACLANWYSHD